jgi:beta-mannosidase
VDAGLIPDPDFGLNSRACEWTSERDWVYVKQFATPELPPGGLARLRFEGVDYECHVFLNGQHLGDHEGMYDAFEFDVTGALMAEGMNQLVVVMEHAPREVGQIGRTSEVRLWKARFAYSWDWCTRLVPIGIFDSVSLLVTGPAFIADAQVTPQLSDDLGAAEVGVTVTLGGSCRDAAHVRVEVGFEGQSLASSEAAVLSADGCRLSLPVPGPRLWWPNGYGEQPLYQARVGLLGEDGRLLDERTVTFGLRRVRAIRNDGAPADALPYVLEVNDKRVFMKGWNWAPISQLYGRAPRERYEHWLGLARNAHCNLLRVWGGGLLEKRAFYELCDAHGIMVWQEFIQSSSGIDNRPSAEPEYLSYIRGQAERMIPRRRNHPSLVIWCGGNELMHDDWTPLDDTQPALAALRDCVQRLDPGRLWLPTSGSGPVANASLEQVGRMHDVHGPWQYQGPEEHYRLYNGIDPLLHAEFGVEGAANLSSMRRCNPPDQLWPPDETNPLWLHRGSWWVQRAMMTRVFGGIADLETYVWASQFLQAEGLRYAIESNRRRKWRCAGTSPWQFNESWPNLSCTNVVDYFGQPRPAYWWCRNAYEPLHVSARYDKLGWQEGETLVADVWVNNSLTGTECTVCWQVLDLQGEVLARGERAAAVAEGSAQQVTRAEWPVRDLSDGIFILRLRAEAPGRPPSSNDYVFSTRAEPIFAPLLSAPRTELRLVREGECLAISNAGGAFALLVRLEAADGEAWLEAGLNYLLLAPGESIQTLVTPVDARVSVTGANFDAVTAGGG